MHRFLVLGAVLAAALVHGGAAGAWSWPADGPVLRPFQLGPDGYAAGQHRGVDVGGDAGSPVRGPAAGTVTFAGAVPIHGRGVTILTADGYAVTLFHLESVAVAKGDVVDEGAVVGTLGSSGDPEHGVPAVHLGIRRADQQEGYVDPLGLLPDRPAAPAPQPPPAATAPAPAAAPAPAPPPVAPPPGPPPVTAAPVPPPVAASVPSGPPGQAAPQTVAQPSAAVGETHAAPGGSSGATAGDGVAHGITVAGPPSSNEASARGSAGDRAVLEAAPGTRRIRRARAVAGATPSARARSVRAPRAGGSADASRPHAARTPGPSAGRSVPPGGARGRGAHCAGGSGSAPRPSGEQCDPIVRPPSRCRPPGVTTRWSGPAAHGLSGSASWSASAPSRRRSSSAVAAPGSGSPS